MILEKILSIFVIMAIGFAAVRLKVVDKLFIRGLASFMMNVALPFAFVASLDRSVPKTVLPELGLMLLWSIGVHALSIAIATVAWRGFPEGRRKVLAFATVFTNSAFMGMPVAQAVAGSRGLMFSMVYNIVYGLLIYSYGMALFREESGPIRWRAMLVNPGNAALAVGLVVWFLPFSLPSFITESIGLMARLQTPLAMFIVGANVAGIRARGLLSGAAAPLAVAMRLGALPLLTLAAVRLSGASGEAPAIAVLMAAMPAGAQTVVVAEQMGGDAVFAAEIVFATTLLSVFTIPLFAALLF